MIVRPALDEVPRVLPPLDSFRRGAWEVQDCRAHAWLPGLGVGSAK